MVSVGSKDHEHHHGLQWQHRSPSVAWLPAAAQATVVPQGDPIQKMRHSSSLTSCSESYLSCSWAACSGAGPLRAPSCLQSPVSAWCSSPHSRGGGAATAVALCSMPGLQATGVHHRHCGLQACHSVPGSFFPSNTHPVIREVFASAVCHRKYYFAQIALYANIYCNKSLI